MFFCVDFGTDAIAETKLMADDPNKRVFNTNTFSINSESDADIFFARFSHENNYTDGDTKLNLGDHIIFNDAPWQIAGFDCEYNRTATDQTVYNNGYGIMIYPV